MLLDGADVRDVDLRSLRKAVAVVSDDPFLFSASVAENIAYGRPGAASQTSKRPRGARRPSTSSRACRMALTRASASAGCRCPAASASAWRSRARCWPTRAC